eukprot:767698-Hanusia_phi.AAC.7
MVSRTDCRDKCMAPPLLLGLYLRSGDFDRIPAGQFEITDKLPKQNFDMLRRTIAIVACAAALSLIALMAVTTSVAPDALFMGDEMDVNVKSRYLTSEAHGKEGGAFVQRLQDMWFVMSNKPGMEAVRSAIV